MNLAFITSGLRTTTQDGGRKGHTHIGVPVGGAMDQTAMRYANYAVGNPLTSPVLEFTLTGPRLRCDSPGRLALSGANFVMCINDQPAPNNTGVDVASGDEIAFLSPRQGCRGYLAIAGEWEVEQWLGSASALRIGSHELLPAAVWSAGDRLSTQPWRVQPWPAPVMPPKPVSSRIRVFRGPEFDVLSDGALDQLIGTPITVCEPSNRVGLRTDTKVMMPTGQGRREMVSSGVLPGTVQLTPIPEHPPVQGHELVAEVRHHIAAQFR